REELEVFTPEGLVVVVGDQDALAADRVVGDEDLAETRVGDQLAQVPLGDAPDHRGDEAVSTEQREAHLELEPDPPAVEPGEERQPAEPALLALAALPIT